MHFKLIFSVVLFVQFQAHSQRADTIYIDSVIIANEQYFNCVNPLFGLLKLKDQQSIRSIVYDANHIKILQNDSLVFYHLTNTGYNRDSVKMKSLMQKGTMDAYSLCQYITYDHLMIRKGNRILFYLIDDKQKKIFHVVTINLKLNEEL